MRASRLLVLCVAVLGLLMSGCITTTSSAPTTTTSQPNSLSAETVTVCAVQGRVNVLTLKRSGGSAGFLFPSVVVSRNVHRIREVARTLCSLPELDNAGKATSCPSAIGVDYFLYFGAARYSVAPIRILSGCESVSGIGGSHWLLSSPGFWPLLGAAMAIPPSDQNWNGRARG
jgi:hypothetical protein